VNCQPAVAGLEFPFIPQILRCFLTSSLNLLETAGY
jgi:hypothetical protein